jgi:single-strand DNA-binding protein
MSDMNVVVMSGRLTSDPEMKTLESGRSVVRFRIATNRVYSSKNGRQEQSSFFDCELWGRQAESFNKYMKKGRQTMIRGYLKQDSWTDQASGSKRSKTIIVVDDFSFVSDGQSNKTKASVSTEEETPIGKNLPSDIPF